MEDCACRGMLDTPEARDHQRGGAARGNANQRGGETADTIGNVNLPQVPGLSSSEHFSVAAASVKTFVRNDGDDPPSGKLNENGFRNAVESRNGNVFLYVWLKRFSENDLGLFHGKRVSDAVCELLQ